LQKKSDRFKRIPDQNEGAIVNVLFALILVGVVIAVQILTFRRLKMALKEDLAAAISAVSTAETNLETSIANLGTRIGSAGSVPDADVQAAIAAAQGIATNLASDAAKLDAILPTP
jgi:hypothetical protein